MGASGTVIDFHALDEKVEPLVEMLDHSHLNDKITQPTCERLCMFFFTRLQSLPISRVEVKESDKTGAIYP